MEPAEFADVVVCGAGPVGLLTALGLAQQGIDTLIIEKRERHVQEMFGRACTLYPRTMELLEQLSVVEEMTQASFIGRTYGVYREGKRVIRKGWQSMFSLMDESFHNYIVNIRQKNSERIFADRYKTNHGKSVHYGWEIVDQKIDPSLGDGYNVTVTISHVSHGKRTVRCKYLVGADGGQSAVRRLANIAMEGDETTYKWVRIDAKMKTDMPEPNVVFASIETKSHGAVLWVRLDRDAYRIGFALSPTLQAKYPDGINQEQVVQEAVDALKPFKLEIERVDWWTQYNVKQKVAETLQKDEYILLAGDAAHTHSSAFAQGMNTGVHDVTNLIWKLAGTLKGWYKPEILASYAGERRTLAQKLINIDKLAAAAISGDVPAEHNRMGLSAQEALQTILETHMAFTVGLGVDYESNILNKEALATSLVAGSRSPDNLLHAPGPSVPFRLHDITHKQSKGRWSLLVFAGNHHLTKQKISALRKKVEAHESWKPMLSLSTIMIGTTGSAWEAFDGPAVGNLYFDTQGLAHDRYGVYRDNGAITVVRPDGILAFAAGLEDWNEIEKFFEPIFASK